MISNPAEPLSPDIKANPARVCVTLLAACYPRRSISCYQPSSSSSSSNSDRPARIFSLNEPANFEAVLRLAQPAHAAHSCMPACMPAWLAGLAWLGYSAGVSQVTGYVALGDGERWGGWGEGNREYILHGWCTTTGNYILGKADGCSSMGRSSADRERV